ncbi:MAG: dephospho-CoA kinase [Polyangiaceae bacterium]|nr:dephospho-CoA kinase [Polyangiaceae bacterium]
MHIFGLTGGIGSGKSSIGRYFQSLGLPVVDADVLAREAVAKGSPALAELVEAFGADILDADGNLDRKALAAKVFGNESARQKLNGITHPRVRELSVQRFSELGQTGEPLACYEVPLLFESKMAEMMRPVVVVSVPEELQIERAMARDDATREEIAARIQHQLPLSEKVRQADFVIDNSGTPEQSQERAREVLRGVCERVGVDASRYGV